jgi:hypothetical protein
MHVNWEALTAIGTIVSAVVIAATVVMAARQVRLTSRQLEHLRRSNDLAGAIAIFEKLEGRQFVEAYHFVVVELKDRLKDDQYRAELTNFGTTDVAHKELVVLRTMENIGGYIRYGLIDGRVIFDCVYPEIVGCWEHLTEVVAAHRLAFGTGFWENYEYLYNQAKRWSAEARADQPRYLTV